MPHIYSVSYETICTACGETRGFHAEMTTQEITAHDNDLATACDITDRVCLLCNLLTKFRDDPTYKKILPRFLKRVIKEHYNQDWELK